MKFIREKTFWSLTFRIFIFGLVILTAMPGSKEPVSTDTGWIRIDYIEHFIMYAIVTILFQLGYFPLFLRDFSGRNIRFVAGFILFAVVTEVYQIPIPRREFNPVDLMLNIAGIVAGIPAGRIIMKYRYRDT
jgi:VanZ family protein